MRRAVRLAIALSLPVGLTACRPPHLVAQDPSPYDDEVAGAEDGALSLVASRTAWFERQLSEVCTPLAITFINAGQNAIPIDVEHLQLTDEAGRTYRALPPDEVARELFTGVPSGEPPSAPAPQGTPPPPPAAIPAPPSAPAPAAPPEETLGTGFPGIVLVGHGGGGHGGGSHGGGHGSHGTVGPGLHGSKAHPGWWAWGPRGYWGFGFLPYADLGARCLRMVGGEVGPSAAEARFFAIFGPQQIDALALRDDELGPHERMGGLVFFEPAWDARRVTLHFETRDEAGTPLVLTTRFQVSR